MQLCCASPQTTSTSPRAKQSVRPHAPQHTSTHSPTPRTCAHLRTSRSHTGSLTCMSVCDTSVARGYSCFVGVVWEDSAGHCHVRHTQELGCSRSLRSRPYGARSLVTRDACRRRIGKGLELNAEDNPEMMVVERIEVEVLPTRRPTRSAMTQENATRQDLARRQAGHVAATVARLNKSTRTEHLEAPMSEQSLAATTCTRAV